MLGRTALAFLGSQDGRLPQFVLKQTRVNTEALGPPFRLPLTCLIEVEGRHIGLVHGHGGWSRYLRSKVRDQFGYDEEHYLTIVQRSFGPIDAIVFGHTHRFYQDARSGVLLFNPGPIAPDFYNTPGPQVGLLHVTACTITSEIAAV